MSDLNPRPTSTRRAKVRRHRRERQVLVFGLLTIALAAIAFLSYGVYRGDIPGPFNQAFNTPQTDFTSNVNLVCPPQGSLPLEPSQVAVRVLNGTDQQGLASNTLATLEGRGFVSLGAANWSRSYDGVVRIMFGDTGIQKAYTVALQFAEVEMVLDTRDNATVDVVLGKEFADDPTVREPLDPALDPTVPLTANAPCLRADLIEAEPAPRVYPVDPLAPSPAPSASPSASPSAAS